MEKTWKRNEAEGFQAATCDATQEGDRWCDGQYLFYCDYGQIVRQDCQHMWPDAVCGEVDGRADCQATPCDAETFEPYCDGEVQIFCREGRGVLWEPQAARCPRSTAEPWAGNAR